ncbi:sensor domain-containing diguanylate cyclase [Bowmanella denitrificans]|uniref:sensor domain-containing diguanylate cyclase n=1 Tax=Bowmanella denitrificans TaxID=366582 RepID=UPI0011AF3C33|nr:sensor domain-containing diguanylate cyclase [Bowmanella denitrificans]
MLPPKSSQSSTLNNPAKLISLDTSIRQMIINVSVYPLVLGLLLFTSLAILLSVYATPVAERALLNGLKASVVGLSQKAAALIDSQLREVSHLVVLFRASHEHYLSLSRHTDLPLRAPEPQFSTNADGVFFKSADNGGAGMYYSGDTEIGAEQRWKARNLEGLDTLYKSIVQTNPTVAQAYFNSWDNMNRIYPYIANPALRFGPVMHMQDFNFYYLADQQHNPERRVVWTSAYLDPAGMGWVVSALSPVYRNDFLEGVVGLDIGLAALVDNLLVDEHIGSKKVFLLDGQQRIVAMSNDMSELLGLPELSGHTYSEKVSSTQYKPDSYRLDSLQDQQLAKRLAQFLQNDEQVARIAGQQHDHLVTQVKIPSTDWQFIMFYELSDVLQSQQDMLSLVKKLVWGLVLIVAMALLLYIPYVQRRRAWYAKTLAEPINKLASLTSEIGQRPLSVDEIQAGGIRELQTLVGNFAHMSAELNQRTDKLVKAVTAKRLIEEKAKLYQRLANTDQLTSLYNRKFLDTVLRQEGVRAGRYGDALSVLLMDVDRFKQINDNYGHLAGDTVLKRVARTLKNSVRASDVLGRWGGEEFLLICPKTSLSEAAILADKLRALIEEQSMEMPVTLSVGVAQLQESEKTEHTLGRADKALYQAKASGRNKVCVAD